MISIVTGRKTGTDLAGFCPPDAKPAGSQETMDWNREASPHPRARLAGIVYLAYFLTAILAQLLVSRKLVLYGTAINLIATGLYVGLTLLFYGLFKPVSKSLSLLAALFSLAGCVVMTLGYFPRASVPISPLWFFGPYCLLIGYLVLRSTFLPRVLGVLMALAGMGWLAFLIPALPNFLSIAIEGLGILAEASLMLWLIVKGVNASAWMQQAGARQSAHKLDPKAAKVGAATGLP
jgi:Domain of unknown function (DUF4386)